MHACWDNIFLGDPPSCPAVTSLLLQYNSFSQNIPYDFFDFMQSLKVLDFSYDDMSTCHEIRRKRSKKSTK
ncbi:hypothetical protein Ahy_B06g081889 [Arachis hypogaea]|uniref:Uncharacterized protein n=1 Tax=Arachis hypogaea TaxID=3818 RepID=A0A444YMI0_ARAHY|nr:hypothetical protein Ahy_B06g081889 [Arachis hypogaea]